MTYTDSRALNFVKRQSSILIVTDKTQYKSGDDVKIIIFAVDFETNVLNLKNTSLSIIDPNRIVVENLTDNFFNFGRCKHILTLANTAVLGTYSINFTTATGKVLFQKLLNFIISFFCLHRCTQNCSQL